MHWEGIAFNLIAHLYSNNEWQSYPSIYLDKNRLSKLWVKADLNIRRFQLHIFEGLDFSQDETGREKKTEVT